MSKRKLGIVTIIVVLLVSIGGGIYYKQQVHAKEIAEKQALLAQIEERQALEEQAKALKADAPVVNISPARLNIATHETTEASTDSNSNKVPSTSQQISHDKVQETTTLTDADIQHLQSYEQFDGNGGSYVSFQDMYSNQKANCEGVVQKFSALRLGAYDKAKVEWLTSPQLVYRSLTSQLCVRGVLSLTYYADGNEFELSPNMKYQREVEYRLRNSVTDGKSTLKLESINYLSPFKAVE